MADGSTGDVTERLRIATLPRLTDRRPLGGQGLEVSPVCLGMVRAPETIPAAFEAGINFFFLTADMHWPLYEATRRGLAMLLATRPHARDEIVIAAASYVTQREFTLAPFLEVLEAVPGLERIDVLVAGGAYADDALARVATYRDHLRHGRIRTGRTGPSGAVALSLHERSLAPLLLREGLADLAFVRYGAAHPGATRDVFPHLPAARSGLLYGFKSTTAHLDELRLLELGLAPSDWRPSITDHYRYALTQRSLDGLLCGLATPREVDDLGAALALGPLDDDERAYLDDLAALDAGRARLSAR